VIHALHGEQDLRKMGGLKKALPITYWTFLIGTLAIAGVPLLSGFFSKDEILWKTYESGHTVLWALGVLTAFLTATYMFRLLYMCFFGESRSADAGHGADTGHGTHAGHGSLHDAPAAMAIALIVLAGGSVLAGYVGVPHVLGGGNRIEAYLEPSFESHAETAGMAEVAGVSDFGAPELTSGLTADEATEAMGEHDAASPMELPLMIVSVVVAFAGIGLAWLFFLKKPELADATAARFSGVHKLLLNKYYVDEFYDGVIVQPIKRMSSGVLWRGVDAGMIDGSVNAVGLIVRGWSAVLRRLQTGSVRAYAMSLFVGVVMIVGYYLRVWMR
jgi:NADH-quinone oxidoreductase subunit L